MTVGGRMWEGRHCVGARSGARIVGVCGECGRARHLGGAGAGASVGSFLAFSLSYVIDIR
jgi:hypothetical protein